VVQVSQACEKRLATATRVLKALHGAQLPLAGVMRWIEPRARDRHRRVCADRIPPCLLVVEPLAYALTVGRSRRGRAMVRQAPQPLANPRTPWRCRARYNRVWNWACNVWRTPDVMAVRFPGSFWMAWRRQWPRHARGPSVRLLLAVLSKPSIRTPCPRYDGSCWAAARCNTSEEWVKAAALASVVEPRCQITRPQTIVGRYPFAVRQWLCFSSAKTYVGNGSPHRVSTVTILWPPSAQTQR
jgi:hypothetical protein